MIHDLRDSERYAMHGMAALVGGEQSLIGHISDISRSGIALNVAGREKPAKDMNKVWLCRVVSPELPGPLEFVARFVRRRTSARGYGLACRIADISAGNLALLDAFQRKRQQQAQVYH